MSRHITLKSPRLMPGVALLSLAVAAGCDGGFDGIIGSSARVESPATGADQVLRVEERDVERADLFEMNEEGLWDGRFSFGDKWVAVNRPVQAERVRITNLSNGITIEGALFQRDETRPGPPIMVSQNAAQALDMFPGTPAELRVVVIRRETVEIPVPAGTSPAAEVTGEDGPVLDGEAAVEVAALPATVASEGASDAVPEGAVAPAEAAAPRPVISGVTQSRIPGTVAPAAVETPAPVEQATDAAAPLDIAGVATSALAAAETQTDGKPRIQVVSGANLKGAEAELAKVESAGLPVELREEGTEANPIYRIISGPYDTPAEYEAALVKLKELGYADVFAVR